MKAGPLRQLAGGVGLLALVPTATMLATGRITPTDAALRAGVTLVGVLLVARIAAWWLTFFLSSMEVTAEASSDSGGAGRRRTDDGPPADTAG